MVVAFLQGRVGWVGTMPNHASFKTLVGQCLTYTVEVKPHLVHVRVTASTVALGPDWP
jgi:hypothetical protein